MLEPKAATGSVLRIEEVSPVSRNCSAAQARRSAAPAELGWTGAPDEFAIFVANVRDYAILMLDATGHVVSWNVGARHIKGYEAQDIVGRHFRVFYLPEDRAQGLPERHLAAAARRGELRYEGWRLRKDGSRFWADVVITAVFDDAGRLRGFGKVTRDVTERRDAEQRLTHRMLHDVLTGLPNRALLIDRIGQALAAVGRHHSTVAAFFVDLDRFKVVNDTFGRTVGDQVLVAVAQRLQHTVRPEDTVARLSGDEFIVICPDLRAGSEAYAIADRLACALAEPVELDDEAFLVKASIGIAVTDDPATELESLLRDADTAMYHAKQDCDAQLCYRMFTPDMRSQLTRRLDLEHSLEHAIEQGELSVVYQPVVRLEDGRVEYFEALLRWNRPHEAVNPAEFIPLVEKTGQIRPIGSWVLAQACLQTANWRSDYCGAYPPGVSVNVSARQLHHGGVVAALNQALEDTGLDPSRICLEVTETQLMTDAAASIDALMELKERGVSLSIDDFGTGYSSLNYLKRLPVDTLKIDRSFVAGLGSCSQGGQDSAIVEATIKMAQALGLSVVAEGVETAQQQAELRRLGCDYGQGWYFARPQPPEMIHLDVRAHQPGWARR
jgi:diguanylate cyclase (GGDEF)-like protein/PAS domain S-box-containing protein